MPMRNDLNGTIYIFTALYPEAQPLIRALHLKKDTDARVFQQYVSEDGALRLVLTGSGSIRAAAAVGYILREDPDSTIVNYGSCAGGAGARSGVLYRLCKLTNADENRTYYPDLLLESSLPEAEIVTGSRMWAKSEEQPDQGLPALHDMEAAAIYEAGNLWLGPHRMHFLKFVSDSGERITSEKLSACSAQVTDQVVKYLENLKAVEEPRRNADDGRIEKLCDRIGTDLRASATMRAQLRQLLRYASLTGIDTEELTGQLYAEGRLPVRDKKSGIRVLNEIREQILCRKQSQRDPVSMARKPKQNLTDL